MKKLTIISSFSSFWQHGGTYFHRTTARGLPISKHMCPTQWSAANGFREAEKWTLLLHLSILNLLSAYVKFLAAVGAGMSGEIVS